MQITIIDYGMGNLHSVAKKIKSLGHTPIITSDTNEVLKAEKLILSILRKYPNDLKLLPIK